MSNSIIDNLPRIIFGLFSLVGMGTILLIIRLSWRQFVRLYKDDLEQCISREDGHKEAIKQRDEAIAFQQERSQYREERMAELIKEIGELREAQKLLERTTQPTTPPPKPSSSPRRSSSSRKNASTH